MKIITSFEYPPIPNRNYDWSAVSDNYDGEPESPVGWGSTEQEAINSLKIQLEEMENTK